MSRAGRKRKANVPRKGGRIDWRAVAEPPDKLPQWNRARELLAELGSAPRLISQRGKAFFLRHLTDVEFEAANRWCVLCEDYDRHILDLSRSVPPSVLERRGISLVAERDPERIEALKARFHEAQAIVLEQAGKPALTALNRLCRDEAAALVVPEAKKALAALIAFFGLKAKKVS
jgi:hypothetical protein